jgi:excisionase family DNA binding protein
MLKNHAEEGELLREREVAAMLCVTTRTCAEWRAQGKIPYLKIGGTVRFRRESIEKLIAGLEQGGQP